MSAVSCLTMRSASWFTVSVSSAGALDGARKFASGLGAMMCKDYKCECADAGFFFIDETGAEKKNPMVRTLLDAEEVAARHRLSQRRYRIIKREKARKLNLQIQEMKHIITCLLQEKQELLDMCTNLFANVPGL